MYEEKNNFSIRSLILQILLVILFVFIMIWLFPTKSYMEQNYVSDDRLIQQLQTVYGRIFASNVESMRDAAKGYFTNERLPKKLGDSVTMTLGEMYEKKLVLEFIDSNGNKCDVNESYVTVTKKENEYQLKVQLTCSDYSDYIIDYMGCYDYCDDCDVTTKPTTTVTNKKYKYKYVLKTENTYSNWSNWSAWSTNKVSANTLTQVEKEDRKELVGYNNSYGITGYKTEKYTEYVPETYTETVVAGTSKHLVDTVNPTYSNGYYTAWKDAGNKTTYDKVLYTTDTTKYTLTSTDRYLDCDDKCKYVTVRYYDVQKRSWKQGTPSCPAGYSLEGSVCNKYETRTDYRTETKTRQVAVERERQVPVYGNIQGDAIYKTVTYYRFRTRTQLTKESVTYKWSKTSNDKTLIKQGYVYTGHYERV